jgi:8-amino-7-oxononanoate synthase
VLGSERRTLAVAERVRQAGFHVQPIRPPTVPANASRLRITVTAAETEETLSRLLVALTAAVEAERRFT